MYKISERLLHIEFSTDLWFLTELISICMLINFIGVLYIVFVMEESKPRVKQDTDKELTVMLPESKSPENGSIEKSTVTETVTTTKGNMCSNVIKDCATVIVRKRSGNGRNIVYLILVIVGLSQALDFGMTVIPFNDV